MLRRRKTCVEGSTALFRFTAWTADWAPHAPSAGDRRRASILLDALTPITKSFPAEWGFESNVLALQVHGGYGYSSEQLPEAWLRDQKLNSIHEGTTGIHGLDLLGRRIVADAGAPVRILIEECARTIERAKQAGVDPSWGAAVEGALQTLGETTMNLGALGMQGDVDGMMRHSADFLSLASITVVAWLWLWQATLAKEGLARGSGDAD